MARARGPRQVRKKSVKLRKDVKKRLDTVFGAVWDVKVSLHTAHTTPH